MGHADSQEGLKDSTAPEYLSLASVVTNILWSGIFEKSIVIKQSRLVTICLIALNAIWYLGVHNGKFFWESFVISSVSTLERAELT